MLYKLFLLNTPFLLKKSWPRIESFVIDIEFLHPVVASKIFFLDGSEVYEKLLEEIDPKQLPMKFGGNLPDLKEFWPPKSTFLESDLIELNVERGNIFKNHSC